MVKQHPRLMLSLLKAGDLLVIVLSWVAAFWMRRWLGEMGVTPYPPQPLGHYTDPMVISIVLAMLMYNRFDIYEPRRTHRVTDELTVMARAVLTTWVILFAIVNLILPQRPSRLLMGSFGGAWLTAAMLSRLLTRSLLRWFRRHHLNMRSAAIIGTGRLGQTLFHALRRSAWAGIEPSYFLSAGPGRQRDELLGLPVIAGRQDVAQVLAGRPVDIVFVALSNGQRAHADELLDGLAQTHLDIRVVPDLLSFHFLRHEVSQLGNLPIISLTHTPQYGWNSLLKRLLDIMLSAASLAVAAGPMLVIAVAIKLTGKGPVFYRQTRTSLGGAPFKILKFRTMRVDAEQATGPIWARPDDPRVTRLGRWLRRTSLDELPQLINVLLGQMSMVGPRPERPELIERFRRQVPRYMLRHHVRAGMTGWAQVHGLRGQTSLRKRVQYDLYYITNWSFGLDLWVLLLTPFRTLISRNAY